jgi:opacity protein-like surface antigen
MIYRFMLGAAFTGSSLAAPFTVAPAHALEPGGWYVGASTADTHVEVFRGLGWEPGGEQDGASARGGVRLKRHLALEVATLRSSGLEWTEYFAEIPGFLTSHTTFDATAVQATAVPTFPWGKTFEGYLKAGIALYDVDGRQVLDTLLTDAALIRDVDDTGTGLLLGAGLLINAAPKWRVRIEYQYFEIGAAFLGVGHGDDPSIDTFSIGIDYRLQRGVRD